MATDIAEFSNGDRKIKITRFARGQDKGVGFQVTWGMQYVQVATAGEAGELANLLLNAISLS